MVHSKHNNMLYLKIAWKSCKVRMPSNSFSMFRRIQRLIRNDPHKNMNYIECQNCTHHDLSNLTRQMKTILKEMCLSNWAVKIVTGGHWHASYSAVILVSLYLPQCICIYNTLTHCITSLDSLDSLGIYRYPLYHLWVDKHTIKRKPSTFHHNLA